jgi:F-type H+-transporting ATPase subunit gamma
MSQIRTFRKKIKSTKNIAKITRAMQLVSASKMKRAQDIALAGKAYSLGMFDISVALVKYLNPSLHPLLKTEILKEAKDLVVLVAPEKGLCGSLISNLARKVLTTKDLDLKNTEFITVGKKAAQIAKKIGGVIIAEFELGLSSPKYDLVPPIANLITDRFINGLANKVSFIYSDFINTMTQIPIVKVLLPLTLSLEEESVETDINKEYLFEPTPSEIVNPFLDMYLEVEIYQILLDAFASEQSARMVAMKNANDNANSLIAALTVDYNKERQTSITAEILDIGNGVAALSQI